MRYNQFIKLVRGHFRPLLEPYGYSDEGSRDGTFHRQVSDELFHFIAPDMSRYGHVYDIHVFPHSPLIDPMFEQLFPDSLSFPNGGWHHLHPKRGVDGDQYRFACESEEEFIESFEKEAVPAIEKYALPYLNQFSTLKDIVPFIKDPMAKFYEGAALWHTGEKDKAKEILAKERDRITGIKDPTGQVDAALDYIDKILN